ncbi:MAG: Flp family type IVb pilin [bacterium]|nr:Flp family type IVb pilin [bacterium]
MMSLLKRFMRNEEGQGMVEYGLIIGLIAVIIIAVVVGFGPQIKTMFSDEAITDKLDAGQEKK